MWKLALYIRGETDPIFQNEAPAIVAKLSMDQYPSSIVRDVFFSCSLCFAEGVFGDFCGWSVVCSERFLFL